MGAIVGQYGKVIRFEVSDRKVLTFSDMEKSQEGRWKEHDVIGTVPQLEFRGPDAGTISLKISLKAQLGVNPRKTIKLLEQCVRRGTVDTLVIGGKKCGWGSAKWVVTSVSETWDRFIGGGLMEAGCTVKFQEYNPGKTKAKAISTSTSSTTTSSSGTGYDVDDIAQRVIAGEFGNGQSRFDALTAAGYDWKTVQNKVNELLGCRRRYS